MGKKYFDDRYIVNNLMKKNYCFSGMGRKVRPEHWCVCVVGRGGWAGGQKEEVMAGVGAGAGEH